MRDLNMTLTGWVAADPTFVITRDGQGPALSTFRMGHTPRYRDRNTREWTDGQTQWFTVRVFNDGAYTVLKSIKKGQPVVVEGRLRTNEWIDNDKNQRVTLQIDAHAVGHDVTKGIAHFNRAVVQDGEAQERPASEGAASEDAATEDESAEQDVQSFEQEPPVVEDDVAPLDEREAALA